MVRRMARGSGGRPHVVVLQARARGLAQGLLLVLAGLWLLGCYRVPEGKSAVESVAIDGLEADEEDALTGKIVTRPSARFLGIFEGIVYDYETFDRYALKRDLARVERWLRARGYYDAVVRAARVTNDGKKVHVTIEVTRGEPVRIARVEVTFPGSSSVSDATRREVVAAVREAMAEGSIFTEEAYAAGERAAVHALGQRGHATASASRRAEVDLAGRLVQVTYSVTAGPPSTFGDIRFEGLGNLPEDAVRRVFGIQKGEVYSVDEIDRSRQALLDLGIFVSVEVEPDLTDNEKTRVVPLRVRTEPSKLRALVLGFGLQFDQIKADVHGTIGWQSSNFLGGLRKLDVRFKPGVVLYPTRLPDVRKPEEFLFEQRLTASVRQPALIERRTQGVLTAEYSTYPILLPGRLDTGRLAGYHEVRGEGGLERSFGRFFASPQYGIQADYPFDYLGHTEGLTQILLSYGELFTYLDLRDDPVRTKKGLYLGGQSQAAGGLLGGDASDVRLQPEARAYVPLRKMVLAVRGSVGFLFPFNYGDAAQAEARNPGTGGTAAARDYQLLFFRGFFGGGPSSNRGYPFRGIGPTAYVERESPAGQSLAAATCPPRPANAPAGEADLCLLPTGGASMWETNVELRIPVSGPFSTATFCDAGDVSLFTLDLRPNLHLSCGAGARYDTPVGPIRLDVGYRIPGLQYTGSGAGERDPGDIFGAPIAIAFGIGEAF